MCQRFDDGCAGGGGEFCIDRDAGEWNAFEDFCGSGGWDRADAMVDTDKSPTGRHSIADNTFDLQQFERHGDSHDIHNGIDSTDFVKVNFVDGGTMYAGFGFGDREEHA